MSCSIQGKNAATHSNAVKYLAIIYDNGEQAWVSDLKYS